MEDKNISVFYKIICCFHPTEYDSSGCDGLYVKSVQKSELIKKLYDLANQWEQAALSNCAEDLRDLLEAEQLELIA